jgi:hypothetical protein
LTDAVTASRVLNNGLVNNGGLLVGPVMTVMMTLMVVVPMGLVKGEGGAAVAAVTG